MNKNIMPYLSAYAVLLVGVVALLLSYPKAELHLLLNSFHGELLDVFMRYYSKLAEAPLYILALLAIYFLRWRWVAFYASCELVGALLVQVIKQIFRQPRPMVFFRDLPQYDLPLVPGVHLHHGLSFPSGHTSTFFIFFTCCALLASIYYQREVRARQVAGASVWPLRVGGAMLMLSMVFLAALGGYSRIYLSQHFLLDVCVGSMIGVAVPCVLFARYSRKVVVPVCARMPIPASKEAYAADRQSLINNH